MQSIYVHAFSKCMSYMQIQITAVEMEESMDGWMDGNPIKKTLKFLNNY